MIVVVNSTALINFSSIHQLEILHKLFNEIIIPNKLNFIGSIGCLKLAKQRGLINNKKQYVNIQL